MISIPGIPYSKGEYGDPGDINHEKFLSTRPKTEHHVLQDCSDSNTSDYLLVESF